MMMTEMLYFVTLGLTAATTLCTFWSASKFSATLLFASLTASLASVIALVVDSGHLPVSGNFEKFQYLPFLLILMTFAHYLSYRSQDNINKFSLIFAISLLLMVLNGEFTPAENYIIYNRVEVVLFFQLRMLGIAFFLFSLSFQFQEFFNRKLSGSTYVLNRFSRNYLLLGAAAFLGGEFFGSLWSLNGWGDPWRWSRSFFVATAIFLLSMLVVHIPATYRRNFRNGLILSAIPLLLILLIYLS